MGGSLCIQEPPRFRAIQLSHVDAANPVCAWNVKKKMAEIRQELRKPPPRRQRDRIATAGRNAKERRISRSGLKDDCAVGTPRSAAAAFCRRHGLNRPALKIDPL